MPSELGGFKTGNMIAQTRRYLDISCHSLTPRELKSVKEKKTKTEYEAKHRVAMAKHRQIVMLCDARCQNSSNKVMETSLHGQKFRPQICEGFSPTSHMTQSRNSS